MKHPTLFFLCFFTSVFIEVEKQRVFGFECATTTITNVFDAFSGYISRHGKKYRELKNSTRQTTKSFVKQSSRL